MEYLEREQQRIRKIYHVKEDAKEENIRRLGCDL